MDKADLVVRIVTELQQELAGIEKAARAAYEGAIHEQSAAEDKYDTRGLEASYLAGAQAKRASNLRGSIGALRIMPIDVFGETDPIRPSALVELESDDGHRLIFLALAGGGVTVDWDGRSVQVVTPSSPIGGALIGREVGDDFTIDLPRGLREFEITAVW